MKHLDKETYMLQYNKVGAVVVKDSIPAPAKNW